MMNRKLTSQRTTRLSGRRIWHRLRLPAALAGGLCLVLLAGSCGSDDPVSSNGGPVDPPTDFFVSAASGSDTATGKRTAPMATIQTAIDSAATTGGRVFVAEGIYSESITLASGVSIFGGYTDVTFVRDTSLVTTINGSTKAITLTNADSVTIDGFTINSANATASGGSSIGIALNSSTAAVITNNVITAGNGFAGVNRSAAANGGSGGNGGSGEDAFFTFGSCDQARGAGGTSPIGNVGGRGAWSTQTGIAGTGPGGGGGAGGGFGANGVNGSSGTRGTPATWPQTSARLIPPRFRFSGRHSRY